MSNNFRTFKLPIFYIDEGSASKLDLYRYIIKSVYENFKKTDSYISGSKTSIGLGMQEFLAHLMYYSDDASLAYQECLTKGYLKRHEFEGVRNKNLNHNISMLLSKCCKQEEDLPIALYSSFKSVDKVFNLTPTPLYYSIKNFINSLEGEEFIISNELVIIPKKQ